VDLCSLKPCWISARLRLLVRNGRISRSSTLMAGQSREIDRNEDPKWRGLPVLGIGMIFSCFQMDGMLADCNGKLKSLMRYSSPSGPKCFRWSIVRLSRPVAMDLLESLIAFPTWFAVKRHIFWSRGQSRRSWRFTRRASGSEVCGTIVVNCLQKALAIFCWSDISSLLKMIG